MIVPVYRVESYLDTCVASIVNQTYRNTEILLVDDGSPDKCPEMCEDWKKRDHRIRVIHKANGGLSDARNVGIDAAKGAYIAFVDSDDWVDLHYLECLHDAIRQTNADVAACDVRRVYRESETTESGPQQWNTQILTPKQAIKDILQNRRARSVVWNKLYRKEILLGERFEVGRLHEDEFFTYRIYDKANRVAYVDLPLYNYRQRAGSIMASSSIRHLDVLDAFLERIRLLQRKYPDLVLRDKVNFCMVCINLYDMMPENEKKAARQRIGMCRKQVHFSGEERKQCTPKQKLYVLGSRKGLIRLFCWIRKQRRKKLDATFENENCQTLSNDQTKLEVRL